MSAPMFEAQLRTRCGATRTIVSCFPFPHEIHIPLPVQSQGWLRPQDLEVPNVPPVEYRTFRKVLGSSTVSHADFEEVQ